MTPDELESALRAIGAAATTVKEAPMAPHEFEAALRAIGAAAERRQ